MLLPRIVLLTLLAAGTFAGFHAGVRHLALEHHACACSHAADQKGSDAPDR
jgi:hypothetical protein